MSAIAICLAVAPVSALVHLLAHYRGPAWLVWAAKPLTTGLLTAAAALAPDAAPAYRAAIVAGLLFSFAGDVFLMLPGDRFVAGLASFLAAHLFYIVAFSRGTAFGAVPALALPFLAAALVILRLLWPRLGRHRVPVVLYVAVLVVMAWQASGRAVALPSAQATAAAAGAALFVLSDGTLAVNRFRVKFPAAQAIVMSTYVGAQWLIAWSVAGSAAAL